MSFASLLQSLKNKQWYHQRFDGAPLYIGFIAQAEVKREQRKPRGTEANVRVSFFKDGKGDWYLDQGDIDRGARVLMRRARHDPQISTRLLRAWKNDEHRFDEFYRRFDGGKLRSFTEDQLLSYWMDFAARSINRVTSSAIIDHFALGTDQYIADLLRKELGTLSNESAFTELFSIATAPTHQSFINASEMELLNIAIRYPQDDDRIKAYQKQYFWITNNYDSAKILTQAYFKKEIKQWRESGADLKKKYQQLRLTAKRNKEQKLALFKRYHLSPYLRTLLKISEDFTWWQDERKKATFLYIHMGSCILKEMVRRRGVDPALTRFFVPTEVEEWFTNGTPAVRVLASRQKECAFIATRQGFVIVTNASEIKRLHDTMFPTRKDDTIRDIRGLSASVGRVKGKVTIVGSVREINKVRQGDILVAVMTRPDYMAGIKKAAAIVTNEGGVTCHAAIVARELGIPCIIATKMATEVLHDGDVIDVNANHGVVTILKRGLASEIAEAREQDR